MKALTRWILLVALLGIYLAALWALMHPRITPRYKAYFIQRTTTDWNPERYPGTPGEGMTFSRNGLPEWVDHTYGFSRREEGGRWTDSDVAVIPGIAFTRVLRGPLCVDFIAVPAPSLVGKTFGLQMGNQTETVQVRSSNPYEYRIRFSGEQESNRVNFLLPAELPRQSEVDPKNRDQRRLGLQLVSMRILSATCSADPQ